MQKFMYFLILIISLGCTKSEVETVNEEIDTTNVKVLYTGQFKNGSNPTSGKISVVEDSDGVRKLHIEDLKSDSGPDLRLVLSETITSQNNIEIVAKPKNGTYSLDIPNNIDFKKHKFALIWCKRFTKVFGSAELKN